MSETKFKIKGNDASLYTWTYYKNCFTIPEFDDKDSDIYRNKKQMLQTICFNENIEINNQNVIDALFLFCKIHNTDNKLTLSLFHKFKQFCNTNGSPMPFTILNEESYESNDEDIEPDYDSHGSDSS